MKIDKARRLITAVDDALDRCEQASPPAVKVTKKGRLRCPWCGGSLDSETLIVLDCAIRWNRTEAEPDKDGGVLRVGDGDGEYQTFGYMAECCMALVALPEGWETAW